MTNYEVIEKLKLIKAFSLGAARAGDERASYAFEEIADMLRDFMRDFDQDRDDDTL